MKTRCHRCDGQGIIESVQECCDWGNCKPHCIENHTGFIRHYDLAWEADMPPRTAPVPYESYVNKVTLGSTEEESETKCEVKEGPAGGSLELEGDLW